MFKFGKKSGFGLGLVLAFALNIVMSVIMNIALVSPASAQVGHDVSNTQQTSMTTNVKRNATSREARRLFLQAKAFHDGINAEKNLARARYYYLKSAGLGNNDARVNLGYLYFVGEGVKQNYSKAHNWYLSAARTGSKEAQKNLAMMYKNGLGVKKDPVQADQWLKYGREIIVKTMQEAVKPEAKEAPKPVAKIEKLPVKTGKLSVNVEDKPSEIAALGGNMLVSALQIQDQKLPKLSNGVNRTNIKPAGFRLNPQASQKPTVKSVSFQSRTALNFRPGAQTTFNLPTWVGHMLVFFLLLLSVVGSIWFVRQYGALLDIARGRAFVAAFYAHHRDSLRTNYLKYPERQNSYSRMDDPWALAMCVLMVRYAQENNKADSRLGEQSRAILKAYKTGSLHVRTCVFKFVATLQGRIISDIYAYDCAKTDGPAPIRYAQKTKFRNVVNLHESRPDRQNFNKAVLPMRPSND